jgi:hypothetical protein
MSVMDAAQSPYLSARQLAEKHGFALGTVRWWLFNRESNGFNKCVVKAGKLVRIREDLFFKWMDAQLEAR